MYWKLHSLARQRGRRSAEIGLGEVLPGAVADVEHIDPLLLFKNAVDDAIYVWLATVEQVPELLVFGRRRATLGSFSRVRTASLSPMYHFSPASESLPWTSWNRMARSSRARGVILTRYAISSFELGKKLLYRLKLSLPLVLQALPDSLFGVCLSGDIEQALVGFGVLHNGRCLPVDSKYKGAFALFEVLHKLTGRAAKCRQRLNVGGDI
jgi:hypothetical protein